MKSLVVSALAIVAMTGATAPSLSDQEAAIQAVLSFYASDLNLPHRLPAGRSICVTRKLSDAPFEGRLDELRRGVRADLAQNSNPAQRSAPDAKIDEIVRLRLWMSGPMPRDEVTQRIVDAAFLVASRPPRSDLRQIDKGWLSGGERLDESDSCSETLELSQPAIEGDHAFVSVSHNCGALCGLQATLLLRKHDERGWRVEDGDIHLIS